MAKKNQNDTRTRNWTVVVYPESAPDNWRQIIDDWHIEWVESPVHDKDVNANGEVKKPHIHLLLMFSSVKSYEQVLSLCQELNCPIPKQVHNSKALIRYMAHLDNPDKAQYNPDDIISHGGISLADLLKPNSSERYALIREMKNWCLEWDIIEFEDLFNYASTERFEDWFPLLCDNCAFVMQLFLKSRRHRNTKSIVDASTDGVKVDEYESTDN